MSMKKIQLLLTLIGVILTWHSDEVNGLTEIRCNTLNIDVRNNPQDNSNYYPDNYHNCTTLEGSLAITMVYRNTEESQYQVFKELREITGHVLIYDINGLSNLGHVLPNLRIVRGNDLLMNYAFVVYLNEGLKFLGLNKLTEISNGGVRIASNKNLCLADDIRWSQIVTGTINDTLIEKNSEVCTPSVCEPEVLKLGAAERAQCSAINQNGENARKLKDQGETLESLSRKLACWNNSTCQKLCTCKTGCVENTSTQCCHAECAGGCVGLKSTDCIACRHVYHGGDCLQTCPPGFVLFKENGRRCVTLDECKRQKEVHISHTEKTYFKATNGVCSWQCPKGYTESPDKKSCVLCPPDDCPKYCSSIKVTSLGDITNEGCEIINGHIEIELQSGNSNAAAMLTTMFAKVREVRDYIKIAFVPQIYSLDMFKSLQLIKGEKKLGENPGFVLSVFENENLRGLIDNGQNLTINGTIRVHNNPHLCRRLIQQFMDLTGVSKYQKIGDNNGGVSRQSNGYKEICELAKIRLNVRPLSDIYFYANWSGYKTDQIDHRKFLGYKLFYRPVDEPNSLSDIYEDRDACFDVWKYEWIQVDMENDYGKDNQGPNVMQTQIPASYSMIHFNKYNTWYAFYVKTVVVFHEDTVGAISDIVYAKSAFGVPLKPKTLEITEVTATSLILNWAPPLRDNGEITHYMLEFNYIPHAIIEQHNACPKDGDPKTDPVTKVSKPVAVIEAKKSTDAAECSNLGCCQCAAKSPAFKYQVDGSVDPDQAILTSDEWIGPDESKDETALDIIPSDSKVRMRRALADAEEDVTKPPSTTTSTPEPDKQLTVNEFIPVHSMNGTFDKTNTSVASLNLTNLEHYGIYEIRIWACQNVSVTPHHCSQTYAEIKKRTDAIPENDDIDSSTVTVKSYKDVNETQDDGYDNDRLIRWDPPASPNGPVISYIVQYWEPDRTDQSLHKCFTKAEFDEGKTVLKKMRGGHWKLQVKARTARGYGQYTDPVSFDVEGPAFPLSYVITFAILIPLIVIIIALVVGRSIWRLKMKKLPEYIMHIVETNPDYIQQLEVYKPDEWELERDSVELLNCIGHGTFGKVYRGRGKDVLSQCGARFGECAVKCVGDEATQYDRYAFLHEASLMKNINTAYIIKLYGVISNGQPALVVMEMMEKGNLKDYLRSRCPDAPETNVDNLEPPTLSQTWAWAGQIADAMCYLEAMKYVHRDVAARNVLVSTNLVCKIADFGMTRDVYVKDYYRPMGKRLSPVRWMAPEALSLSTFTSKSDVWAFGIVMWEMVTLGLQPYPGIGIEGIQEFVVDRRGTMVNTGRFRPVGCPQEILNLMEQCWRFDSRDRPTFHDICQQLLPHQPESFIQESFYCNGGTMKGNNVNSAGEIEKPSKGALPKVQSALKNSDKQSQPQQPKPVTVGQSLSVQPNTAHNQPGTTPSCSSNNGSVETQDSGVRTGDSNQSIAAKKLNRRKSTENVKDGDTPLGSIKQTPVCKDNRRARLPGSDKNVARGQDVQLDIDDNQSIGSNEHLVTSTENDVITTNPSDSAVVHLQSNGYANNRTAKV